MYHNMLGGGTWFSWIFWIIIIALIGWLVMSKMNRPQKNSRSTKVSPLDILKNKYAKGEINKEEFQEKKKDLS